MTTTTTTQNCRYDGCVYWAIDPSRGHLFCGQHADLPERYCERAALMRDCPHGHDWDSDPLGRPVHHTDEAHEDAMRAAIERERQEDEYGPALPEDEEERYAAHLIRQDAETVARFLLDLSRQHMVSLPEDIANAAERIVGYRPISGPMSGRDDR